MSILEKVLQPLLNAQRELGHAEGRTEGHAELRSWLDRKNRAEAEGKPFNEPPPDERE